MSFVTRSDDPLLNMAAALKSQVCAYSLYLVAFTVSGEICAFRIHGQDIPFKAEVLNKTSGEGVLKAAGPIDCEQQKDFTFIVQAYDCGADVSGGSWKKSHKCVDVICTHP